MKVRAEIQRENKLPPPASTETANWMTETTGVILIYNMTHTPASKKATNILRNFGEKGGKDNACDNAGISTLEWTEPCFWPERADGLLGLGLGLGVGLGPGLGSARTTAGANVPVGTALKAQGKLSQALQSH